MTETDANRSDVEAPVAHSKLSAEDLERVKQVTSTGINSIERKPFRPGLLLLGILASIIVLGQMSIWVASFFLNE